jgi:hypothetical protein
MANTREAQQMLALNDEITAYAKAMDVFTRRNIHALPMSMAQYLQWTDRRIAQHALLVDHFNRLRAESLRIAKRSHMRPKL